MCDENERKKKERKKRLPRKKFCGDRKAFIRLYQKNGCIDFYELQDIDSSNNEGTNCLVDGQIGRESMVRRAWSHHGRHKSRNGWYLVHSRFVDSI